MAQPKRLHGPPWPLLRLLVVLLAATGTTVAASSSAPFFCKCTCFTTNSTIFQLEPATASTMTSSQTSTTQPHQLVANATPMPPQSPDDQRLEDSSAWSGEDGFYQQPPFKARGISLGAGTEELKEQQKHNDVNEERNMHRAKKRTRNIWAESVFNSPLNVGQWLIEPADAGASARRSVLRARAATQPCAECTRAFCLSKNLTICEGAKEEKDVQTMCFQRDSRKDRVLVWGFILSTGALLGWAGVRRLMELRSRRLAHGGASTSGGGGVGSGSSGSGPVYEPVNSQARWR